MSQSSIEMQVKDLADAGMTVRSGARLHRTTETAPETLSEIGETWLIRWARNACRNFTVISKGVGIKYLYDACGKIPAFCVGVGPSLDRAMNDLKLARGRAVIISTDAALRALLANGITPDLVISYDAQEIQKKLWETIPTPLRIPCLFSSCSHPASIDSWPGPVLFYNQWHQQDELCKTLLPGIYPHIGQIASGGTVGNMALMAGTILGCDPVCAVGMDFCYAPNEKGVMQYRATDYRWMPENGFNPAKWEKFEIAELYSNAKRLQRSKVIEAGGRSFTTDPELELYLDVFERVLPHFKVPVVNCSPDGMLPHSMFPPMTVLEAVQKYCHGDLGPGRTVLPHLHKILDDPRR